MKKKISHIPTETFLEISQGKIDFSEGQKRHFKLCTHCQGEYQKIQSIQKGVKWDKELEEMAEAGARDYFEQDTDSVSLDAGWLKFKETLFKKEQQQHSSGKLHIVIEIIKNIPKLLQSPFHPSPSLAPLPTRGETATTTIPVMEGVFGFVKIVGWVIYFPKERLSSLVFVIKDSKTEQGLHNVGLNLFDTKGKKLASSVTNDEGKAIFHKQLKSGKYFVRSKKKEWFELRLDVLKQPLNPRSHTP